MKFTITPIRSALLSPSRSGRAGARKGGAILEAALTSLIFFCMLIGAVDFGQFLFIHQALVERARSAARWGAVNGGTNLDGTRNMVLYNQPTVPSEPSGYFGLTSSMVTVTNPDMNTDAARLSVRIDNYRYQIFSPYIAGTYTGPGILVSVPLGMWN